MKEYDILIVGLGPAGATLARLLSESGLTVAAVDSKSNAPDSFRKPCGGLLAPDAQRALSRYNISLPREVLASPQIFAVKTIDLPSGLVRHYQRCYLNTDRHRFDLWLISLIGSGVDLFQASYCQKIERATDGFRVTLTKKGENSKTLFCRKIIGADGANSIVRRTFLPKRTRQYVCIQQWFPENSKNPYYAALFDERITDCYAWSDSKDGYLILGAALPKQGCRAAFEQLKKNLTVYGYHFPAPLYTEACLVNRPASPFEFSLADKGVFLIGEAAGFVSPSSLEGISSAMKSAQILAEILQSGQPELEKAYCRSTRRLRIHLTMKLLKCPFLYHPLLRRLILRSGFSSIPTL